MGNSTMDVLAERFLKRYVDSYTDAEKTKELATSMQDDGSWQDLDYEGEKLPFWKCIDHFERLNYLAMSGKHDDLVIKGLNFWYIKERKDSNWWWNEIGIQLSLAISGILLKDKFDAELKKKVCETFNEYIKDWWTGTNRSWFAQNIIVRGIIAGDPELIRRGRKYLEDNIFMSEVGEEGIQPDFAFAQHGPQLYNNGYGTSMVNDAARWIGIFEGTEFVFSQEKTDIITNLLLDGSGYMCFRDVPDYNTVGRDIVRSFKCRDDRVKRYLPAIEILKKVSKRSAELEQLEAYIKGDTSVFERTKMFQSLNIMTTAHNGGYASVRFGSDKVLGGDVIEGKIINDEDRWSGYRGCFATQYMVTSFEYDRVFPIWNWAFVPGVTCPNTDVRTEIGGVMKSTFASGVSDGKNGVCAIDLNEDFSSEETVVFGGKKACFVIDGEIFHLGCDLYSKTTLNTTINQCNFDKSFNVDGVEYGLEEVKKSAKYILHGGIGYVFANDTDVVVSGEHRKGTWNKITFIPETVEAEGDMFTAYIPQENTNSYEYAVLLNVEEKEVKDFVFPQYINSSKAQAVAKGNIICVVFYEACEIKVGDSTIKSNAPCFAILKDGKVDSHKAMDENITVEIICE